MISRLPGLYPAHTSATQPQRTTGAPKGAGSEEGADIHQVRSAVVSAFRNPRFALVLDKIMDPRSSEVVAFMRRESGPAGTDLQTATARYLENG